MGKPLKTVERSLELDEIIDNLIHIGYVNGYNQLAQMAQVAPYNHIEPITVDEAKADLYQLMLSLVEASTKHPFTLQGYSLDFIDPEELLAKLSEHFNGEGEV